MIQITYIIISSIIMAIARVLGTLTTPIIIKWFHDKRITSELVVNDKHSLNSAKEHLRDRNKVRNEELKFQRQERRARSIMLRTKFKEIKKNERLSK